MQSTLKILGDEPIGVVSPRLYGHFAEHLGRCCYDGLWVGAGSQTLNEFGFRSSVFHALKKMPTPLLRWPGGCFADHYHWRDGIGDHQLRPARLGLSCGRKVVEDNSLGTDEFLTFCQAIGAEPYLAGNMGSGSVQELCDWIEYCNCGLSTTLAAERAANGRSQPWGVKLWGIGNENWGCGGHYEPESYALEYRRYSVMAQMVDPSIEMVFCGHDQNWNERALNKMRDHIGFVDHFSIHRYWTEGGPGTLFDEDGYYRLLKESDQTEQFVLQAREFIDDAAGSRKHIGIALDEWGVWHPEARTWGPGAVPGEIGDYSQAGTLRDAIAAAVALEGFHRQCRSISLANLAQVVNVLHAPVMTQGAAMWITPTYHLLQMHACHIGQTAYRSEMEAADNTPGGGPSVSATATGGGVTVANRHYRREAVVQVRSDRPFRAAALLSSESASDENGPETPSRVQPIPLRFCAERQGVTFEMPAHSVATLTY